MRLWACALLLLAATGCGEGPKRGPFLVETANAVRLNGAGVTVAPPRQLVLAAGDVVEVEPGGVARLIYADGTRVLLVGRKDRPARLNIARPGGAARAVLKLLAGTLSFFVPPKRPEKNEYQIEALSTLTLVRGTSGRIVTAPDGDQVALATGSVEVTRLDGSEKTIVKELEELFARGAAAFEKRPYNASAESELELYEMQVDRTRHGF